MHLSSELNNSVFSLQSELSQSLECSQNLKTIISKLEFELKSKVSKTVYDSVKNELDSTQYKNTKISSENSRLKDQLTKLSRDSEKENSNLRGKIHDLISEIQNVRSENSRVRGQFAQLSQDAEKENSELKKRHSKSSMRVFALTTQIRNLTAASSNEITKLRRELKPLKMTAVQTQLVSRPCSQSKVIKFSRTRKHPQLQVIGNRKRVVYGSDVDCVDRNILGEDPLRPGNFYSWKLRYEGSHQSLVVGVIDESKFRVDGECFHNAHCYVNSNCSYGCRSGNKTIWNPYELLQITANLINYTLTIKYVSNPSITLTGTLPRLSSGNFYLFASLFCCDHVLEIVE
ncbi:hypothetical protein GEMRC1_000251 [Eukaryota sp. GEM-RC1]